MFSPFLIIFEPYLTYLELYSAIFVLFWDQHWTILGDFGPFFLSIRGSFWVHLGIILASFWHHFEVVLTPFGPFLTILAHFWAFLPPFCVFFCDVSEVKCNIKQRGKREVKNMQNSAKIHQKYAKLCENKPFLPIKHFCFCLKNGQKSTFQPMNVWSKWVCLEAS